MLSGLSTLDLVPLTLKDRIQEMTVSSQEIPRKYFGSRELVVGTKTRLSEETYSTISN